VASNVKWPVAAALLCAVALGLLALLVYGGGEFRDLDTSLFERLAAHRDGRGGEWGEAIALLADPVPFVALLLAACGIGLARGRPLDALAALVVVVGANVTTQLLKAVLSHPRAQALIGDVRFADVGFPSGHTTAAFSIAIAYAFVLPRDLLPLTLAVGAVFGAAVGGSVVVIAWHYPSDVLGGFLVASCWGFATLAATQAIASRESRRAPVSRPGPLPSP
jgi:membrane-associated phospholipid phosphatase